MHTCNGLKWAEAALPAQNLKWFSYNWSRDVLEKEGYWTARPHTCIIWYHWSACYFHIKPDHKNVLPHTVSTRHFHLCKWNCTSIHSNPEYLTERKPPATSHEKWKTHKSNVTLFNTPMASNRITVNDFKMMSFKTYKNWGRCFSSWHCLARRKETPFFYVMNSGKALLSSKDKLI